MGPMDPALVNTVVAMCVAALMVRAGVATRRLERRPNRGRKRRR